MAKDKGASGSRELVRFLMAPILITMMMVGFAVPAMRAPEPRDLNIGIVGATTEQLAVIESFEWSGVGEFDFVVVDDAATMRQGIEDQKFGAGLVLNPDEGDRTVGTAYQSVPSVPEAMVESSAVAYVASANGSQLASGAVLPVRNLALELGIPLQVLDLQVMSADDSAGIGMMFFALATVIAGFLSVNMLATFRPAILETRKLAPVVFGFGAFITLIAYALAHLVLGTVDGSFLPIFVTGLLTVVAVGYTTAMLVKALGQVAILLVMMLFVAIGMPASGASTPMPYAPAFYRFFHEILPLPAAVESIRAISYFDSSSVWSHWAILAAWIVVSAIGLELINRRKSAKAATNASEVVTPNIDTASAQPAI